MMMYLQKAQKNHEHQMVPEVRRGRRSQSLHEILGHQRVRGHPKTQERDKQKIKKSEFEIAITRRGETN